MSAQTLNTVSKVLVVDDHPIVRQGLAQFVDQQEDMVVCGEVGERGEAMSSIESSDPDLVIVDLELGEGSGLDLVKDIKAVYPDLCMLVLSMHDESLYAERALRAGARGYIMKQEKPQKVIEAMRKVIGGDIHVSPEVSERILQMISSGRFVESQSPVDQLSDREFEVLQLIAQGNQTRHIAELLSLSPKTVEAYKARIRQKLMLKNAAELSRFAASWAREQAAQ